MVIPLAGVARHEEFRQTAAIVDGLQFMPRQRIHGVEPVREVGFADVDAVDRPERAPLPRGDGVVLALRAAVQITEPA